MALRRNRAPVDVPVDLQLPRLGFENANVISVLLRARHFGGSYQLVNTEPPQVACSACVYCARRSIEPRIPGDCRNPK